MKIEEPGKFFHPLLATLITGAARLMLAIAESLCFEKDLDWAFCDTDSMAIAKPGEMGEADFFEQARSICEWFSPLNPYEKKGSIFKIEDANFPTANSEREPKFEPLYCLCISAKRYALFNVGKFGEIIIRKASAHGLGQYLAPYEEEDAPGSIPPPSVPLDAIGVDRWQYDLWHEIIRGALDGRPDEVGLSYHEGLNRAAASRYGATTPALLKWFKTFNHEKAYADQVKPFNFLNAFQARLQFDLSDADQSAISKRGRPRKQSAIRPVAPFNKDMRQAARSAFDRGTGNAVKANTLATYAEALAQYHLRSETKFLNGEYCNRGRTERRHVVALQIVHIGKEANKWEEQYFLGPDDDAEIEYDVGQTADAPDLSLRELCRELGEREAARKLEISRTALRRAMKLGAEAMSRAIRGRLRTRVQPKAL
jgi:hypothetical protein